MFYGNKEFTIDDKGRLTLSSMYKDGFPTGKCFACYGMDGCLEIFPEDVYKEKAIKITSLNDFDETSRKVKRTFLSNTFEISIDSHSRILLPKTLLDKTSLNKNVICVGMFDHLELWDEEVYKKLEVANDSTYAKDANKVIGGN